MSRITQRLLRAEALLEDTEQALHELLFAVDHSEMSNEQAALEKLRRLYPRIDKFLMEI